MSAERGFQMMQDMLGKEGAEAGRNLIKKFDASFADFVFDTCFDQIWGRPGLQAKYRSIATISALIAMGKATELKAHIKMGLHNGLTQDEIKEIIIHLSQYCGMPSTMEAVRSFSEATK